MGGARERAVQWGVEPSGTTAELGHTGAMWVLLDLLLVCLLLQDPLCLAGTHTGSQAVGEGMDERWMEGWMQLSRWNCIVRGETVKHWPVLCFVLLCRNYCVSVTVVVYFLD